VIAALLGELRRRGVELQADGPKLRVFGPAGAYSSALRARLLANKAELLEHLRRTEERASAEYDRDERAWASTFLRHMALASGYGDEFARLASDLVGKAPARAPFRIERDVIVVAMGDGLEVRIHREAQPWLTSREGKG
jgi:hypothetical protein